MSKDISPFDFVKAINKHEDIIAQAEDPEAVEAAYVPYLINKAFSYYPDTIFFANEINLNNGVPKKMQNDYYLNSIRPTHRYAPWHKRVKTDEIQAIQDFYQCNFHRAQAILRLLSNEELKYIIELWKNNESDST
jgi:hypothetical protein